MDAERIGALGICASGGYLFFAAQTDVRIKAVGTISAVDMGDMYRNGMDGKQTPEGLQQMLGMAVSLRSAEAGGAEPTYNDIVPPTLETGGEAYEYYLTPRGQHPRSNNKILTRSIDRLVAVHSFRFLSFLASRPVLMIAGTNAHSKGTSEDVISRLTGSKELFWV